MNRWEGREGREGQAGGGQGRNEREHIGRSAKGGGFGICCYRRENAFDSFLKIKLLLKFLLLNIKCENHQGRLPYFLQPGQSSWIYFDQKFLDTSFTNIVRKPSI